MTSRFLENGTLSFGDNDTKAIRIQADTVDGADDYRVLISSGGAAGPSRGAYVEMHGNEFSSNPGRILWESGTAASGTAIAWQVNVGASSVTGHSIDGNGANTFGPATGLTTLHLIRGSATGAASVVKIHNTSITGRSGIDFITENGTTSGSISSGTGNAAGMIYNTVNNGVNTLFQSSGTTVGLYTPDGIWSLGDGTLSASTPALQLRKTNAVNNRLLEGIDAATRGFVRINSAQTNLEFEGTSDRRIKTEITTIQNAIDKVMYLNPVTFRLKNGVVNTQGFIAQEFAEVFPQAVTATDDGLGDDLPEGIEPWTMSDSCLIPYLVKAIQELKAEIELLKGN